MSRTIKRQVVLVLSVTTVILMIILFKEENMVNSVFIPVSFVMGCLVGTLVTLMTVME